MMWKNWLFKDIQTTDELKDMVMEYTKSKHTHVLFDTETNGLRIGDHQDYAFIISFGWLDEDLKSGHTYVFDANPTTLKFFKLLTGKKYAKYVWAWNTKFDINIMKNTEQHFDIHLGYQQASYSNFADGMALYRITQPIEADTNNMTLKGIATREINHGSKQDQDKVKAELSVLQRNWDKLFKEAIKEKFPEVKFDSSMLTKIKNGDIFSDDIYVDYYYDYVSKNPEPTYLDVYKKIPETVRHYAMVDIVLLGEIIAKYYPLCVEYDELDALDTENSVIPAIAQQERNGVPIDIEYLYESRDKVKDYYNYIESKLNNIIIESKKHPFINVDMKGQYVQGANCFNKPRKVGNTMQTPSIEFMEKKLNDFRNMWKSDELMNTNSSEQIKMYFFVMTGSAKQSFDKQEMSILADKINEVEKKKKSEGKELPINLRLVKAFIKTLKEYRRISKWGNTYIGRFIRWYKESDDGKVHPSFAPFKVLTGRFSSPFQQQPKDKLFDVRTGEEIFSPRRVVKVDYTQKINGKNIVGVGVADLAQIEMRVGAIWTIKAGKPDDTLIGSIFNGVDLHARTAGAAFHPVEYAQDPNLSDSLVTKDERQNAKAINFGMQYGGGMQMVRNNPNITEEDGIRLFDAFRETRQGTIHFQQWCVTDMLEHKLGNTDMVYAENLFGRKYFEKKEWVEKNGYRISNYLIQGTCAYALKHSIVLIHEYIRTHNLDSQLILNIHDEVQILLVEGEEYLMGVVEQAMEDMDFAKGVLPIKADLEFYKDNWNEKINIEMDEDRKNFHKVEEGKA